MSGKCCLKDAASFQEGEFLNAQNPSERRAEIMQKRSMQEATLRAADTLRKELKNQGKRWS